MDMNKGISVYTLTLSLGVLENQDMLGEGSI